MAKRELKIDFNIYVSQTYPVALFARDGGWFSRWRHIESYETIEAAEADAKKYMRDFSALPKYL